MLIMLLSRFSHTGTEVAIKYGAEKTCLWFVNGRDATRELGYWGLASSTVVEPKPFLLQTFFPTKFTKEQREHTFVSYLTGYLKTDGCLGGWGCLHRQKDEDGNHMAKLHSFNIVSTKKPMLDWINTHLINFGFQSTTIKTATLKPENRKDIHTLKIPINAVNKEILKRNIDIMKDDPNTAPLTDKILLLKKFLDDGFTSPKYLKASKLIHIFDNVGIYIDKDGDIVFKEEGLTEEENRIILVTGQ